AILSQMPLHKTPIFNCQKPNEHGFIFNKLNHEFSDIHYISVHPDHHFFSKILSKDSLYLLTLIFIFSLILTFLSIYRIKHYIKNPFDRMIKFIAAIPSGTKISQPPQESCPQEIG